MPCTQTGSLEGDHALALEENIKLINKRNTELTQMLCSVLKIIEKDALDASDLQLTDLPKDVQKWWKTHRKIDAKAAKRG